LNAKNERHRMTRSSAFGFWRSSEIRRYHALASNGVLVFAMFFSMVPIASVHAPSLATAPVDVGASNCSSSGVSDAVQPLVLRCSIIPSDNAFVDDLFPSKSFGGLGVLIVQNVPSVPVSRNVAFLKFNLSQSLPTDLVQSLAKPLNASLALYVRLTNFFYNATVEIHPVSPENWTEANVTWNTMPQIGADSISADIQQNGTWARWNVTRIIEPVWNSSGDVAFAAVAPQTSWRNLVWFDSKEYQFSNGATSPRLDLVFVEPTLTVETPYPLIPITVGDKQVVTDSNGTAHLLLPWGAYSVSVPDVLPLRNGTRAAFEGWSDRENSSTALVSLGNNLTLKAYYGIQNRLDVFSSYGVATGAGWYFQDVRANVSLMSSAVPLPGIAGWLGGRYVFDHWNGDCQSPTLPCVVLMNEPKIVVAVWRMDWTITYLLAGLALATAAAVVLMGGRQTRPKRRASKRKSRMRSHVRISLAPCSGTFLTEGRF